MSRFGVRRVGRLALLVPLGLGLGGLTGCPEEPCTAKVEFRLADGARRPEYLSLGWQIPGGQARVERFPESGGLPSDGSSLGTLTRTWAADQSPGDRHLGVVGYIGEMKVVQAVGTVRWAPGETVQLTLTLQGPGGSEAPASGAGGSGGNAGSAGVGGGGAGGSGGAGGAAQAETDAGMSGSAGSGGALSDAGSDGGTSADGAPDPVSSDPGPAVLDGPLLLHWPFEELDGNDVEDLSGRGRGGRLAGSRGRPDRVTDVPAVQFLNARSLAFERFRRSRVDGPVADTTFKEAAITVSLWYRAGDLDDEPMTLLKLGQSYRIRFEQTGLLVEKRVRSGTTGCRLRLDEVLDGAWHHLAVLFTAKGMTIAFDGMAQVACRDDSAIAYEEAPVLVIGRGDDGRSSDFEGLVDEVRVYGRALTRAEIARLGAGLP